jgi:hypothetical protein
MSILYPVAASADEAIRSPKGLATREREAAAVAGGAVSFVSQAVGPAFTTREALVEVFKAAASQPWAKIQPVAASAKPRAPVKPVNQDGHRWPQGKGGAPALWRLTVSYWRTDSGEQTPVDHARKLLRDPEAGDLDSKTLRALSRQPLRAMKPQQPLDIGLFEVRLPDAPHLIIPDE